MNPSIAAPLQLIRAGEKRFPGISGILEDQTKEKADGLIQYPDYCALPISEALTSLIEVFGLNNLEAAKYASALTAGWIWNKNRIILQYDPTLVEMLAEQAEGMEDTDVLPTELLLHLPYPCIYIRAQGLWSDVDGFWVWIEYDVNREAPEFRVQYIFKDGSTSPGILHLVHGGTIADCIRDTDKETARNIDKETTRNTDMEILMLKDGNNPIVRAILIVIQLVLYLVADNTDVEMRTPPRLKRKKGKSRKHSKPERPIQRGDVGFHIGAAIRRQSTRPAPGSRTESGTGSPKRPHTRRGHWHHYWIGKHDSPERKLVLRWTAPTVIHPDDGSNDVTVYPVK